jgi:hypothetical protein
MENSETIDDDKLADVAKALGVTVEAIKNFSEEGMVNYFNNVYDNEISGSIVNAHASNCSFNPLDKMMELVDENRKLYERLLESEKEKNTYLEKFLREK